MAVNWSKTGIQSSDASAWLFHHAACMPATQATVAWTCSGEQPATGSPARAGAKSSSSNAYRGPSETAKYIEAVGTPAR